MQILVKSIVVVLLATAVATTSSAQCTRTWNNAAGGSFQIGTNWNPSGTPGPTDHACIILDAAYTVTLDGESIVDTLTLGSVGAASQQVLELGTSDTLTLNSLSFIRPSGVLELNRGAVFPTDTLVNQGVVTITGSTPGIIKNGIVRNDSLILVDGPAGGNLRLATGGGVDNYGVIELHDAHDILLIDNASTTDVPDTLRNQVGGLIVAIGADDNDRADITVPMRNQGGTIDAQVGVLRIHNDQIIDSAVLETGVNAKIEFYDGTKTFMGLMTGSPEGDVELASSVALVISDTATFHMSGMGFELFSWDGTGGVIHNLGYMRTTTFSSDSNVDGITFINDSVFAFTEGGDFDMMNGARFENHGTLRFEGNTPNFIDAGGADSLINYGTGLISRINGLPNQIEIPFANYGGSIELDASSTLRFFENSILEGGWYQVGGGGRLAFTGGATYHLSGVLSGTGQGVVEFGGVATLSISDSATVHFAGGGAGSVGAVTWTGGGTVTNAGLFTYDGTLGSSPAFDIETLTFVNDSVFKYVTDAFLSGSVRLMDAGRFENAGELRAEGPNAFLTNGAVTADSLVNLPTGSIIRAEADRAIFDLDVLNFGKINAETGILEFWAYLENKPGGILEGFGEIDIQSTDAFVTGGIAAPGGSTGILTIDGDFEMEQATAALAIELDGTTVATEYDQLAILGNGDLGGDIDISLGFLPSVGDMFEVVTTTGAVNTCQFPDTVFLDGLPYSAAFKVNCNAADVTLEVVGVDSMLAFTGGKVFLEGPFSGAAMSVGGIFSPAVPLTQPFDDALYDGSPLDHDSLESVTSMPAEAIDWLLLSLRTGTDHTTEVSGSRRSAILLADGSIVGLGNDTTFFDGVGPGSYRVVVRSRNHMAVMSADPIDFSSGIGGWDFTTALSQAFGSTPMKALNGGVFGLFGSDANFDGQSTAGDFNGWLSDTKAAATGYLQTDFNLDGQVTATDFNLWLLNTKSVVSSDVPDP